MLKNSKISGFADEINEDIAVQVKLLKKLGISHIELRSANGKNISDFTLEEARELKNYFSANQIRVSAIGSPVGKIQITDDFEPHFKIYQRVVEIAKIMETPYIRMFSFFMPDSEEPGTCQGEVFARLQRLIAYAGEQGVVLLHENEKDIYGDNALRCLQLFEKFYGDHFKCTFDFANFVQCRQDTIKAYEMLEPYVEYVHIKDAAFETGEVTPAGEGDGKVKEILAMLDQKGYSGFLSLEPHLTEFAALKSLEKNAGKREMTDGELAFTIAYEALRKILD